MIFTNRIHISVAILLIVGIACSTTNIFTSDTNAVNTSVAQTVPAALTQNTNQVTLSPALVATSTSTFSPEPPTFTPTQTLTATLAFTSTPFVPLISVSVNTNCRNGPGKVYDMVGALLIGETAEVYGRESTNNYWYILNPDLNPKFCWVWGKYATLVGPALLMPIFTPPPTPTATLTPLPTLTPTPSPAFNADYASQDTCNSNWWVEVILKNTGSIPFKSVNISVKDKLTDVVLVNLADGFTNLDGCLVKTTKDTIGLGDTYLLSAPAFAYNPTGHNLVVVITLCSDTGQKGLCATRKLNFKP